MSVSQSGALVLLLRYFLNVPLGGVYADYWMTTQVMLKEDGRRCCQVLTFR